MRKSIRIRLTAIFIGLAIVPLAMVGGGLGWQGFQNQQQQTLDSQHEVARRVATEITAFIHELEVGVQVIIHVQGVNHLSSDEQAASLNALIAYQSAFDELILLDNSGTEQISCSRFRGCSTDNATDYSDADEFTLPITTRNYYYSPVEFDESTGEPLMTIAIPFYNRNNEADGVLIARTRIKRIWELIQVIKTNEDEYIYIIDSENRVIAHPNPAVVLRETTFALPEEEGLQNGLQGEQVVLSTYDIQLGNQVLTIVTEKPTSVALAPAFNTVYIVAGVTLLAFVIAIGLGYLAVGQFVRPVQILAMAARSMSEGQLQPVDIKREDEVGELASAFNSMSVQLHQMLTGLEQRVANRTRDLQIAAEVARQITRLLDINELMQQVVQQVGKSFGFYSVFVFLLDEEKQALLAAAGADQSGNLLDKNIIGTVSLDTEPSLLALAARTGEVVNIKEVSESPDYKFIPKLAETRSELVIPMKLRDDLIGVFDIQSKVSNRFDDDDIRLLTTLAEQVAVAVRNAQLFNQAHLAVQEAERANQVKSQFLAAMSHELRTPLNSVLNLTKFVSRGTLGNINNEQKDMLEKVVESGTHLLNLINDILDISKIEAGSLQLFFTPNVNIKSLVLSVAELTGSLLGSKPVEVILELNDSLPTITADERRIRQIILNLISNACKFTREGCITIAVHQQANEILMTVRDTGPGITAEEEAGVFEIFTQTKAGLLQGEGTGLGLPISKRLAEAHGGRLWLDKTYTEGAAFCVALPITRPEEKGQ